MIELLLAATLSCADAAWILQGVERTDLSVGQKAEIKIEILKEMPDDCDPNDYTGSRK